MIIIIMSCVTFRVVLRRMVFNIHASMKMEQTQCSETSAIKHHTPENNPKCYTRHTKHGESLKSRIIIIIIIQLIYLIAQ
jgi:hypothetical protein